MDTLKGFSDFFLVPDQNKNGSFKCYLLGDENDASSGKNFCLIPYKNPKGKKPEIFLFPVIKETEFDFSLYLSEYSKDDIKPIKLIPATPKNKYKENLAELKNHIQLGDIYEINYCIEFFAENVKIDPLTVFFKLNNLTKAPYASLLKINDEYIISASPELFLKKEGDRIYTKPIKGTAKRGPTAEEDEILKNQLYNSVKERTENVMAVDVARNDLSVIAKRGTVEVNKLYNIETFETVHQMVSTVSCELKDNIKFDEIIAATFPMASMTGAPKISAMKFIDEFENFDRNYYSGAMGLINKKNDFELAVNIRSIFYNEKTKRLSIAVGSAITHLCDPEKEYEECLLKANALLRALNATI